MKILIKYRNLLWSSLQALGPWGVFVMAALDGAGLPLPGAQDAVMATYVYLDRGHAWMYVLLASAGSAVGSLVLYFIGRGGGEVLIEKRMTPAKFEKIRDDFEQHPFLTVAVPAIMPPPFPLKIVILAAGAFKMRWHHMMFALAVGRMARYSIVALLAVVFGPTVVLLFSKHLLVSLGIIAVAVLIVLLILRVRGRKARLAPESESLNQ